MQELTKIELDTLEAVTGGFVDFGTLHTVIKEASSCAMLGLMPGMMTGNPRRMAIGGLGAGALCAATAYGALRQQGQQPPGQQPPSGHPPTAPR
jgi:hypothetical protein